MEEELSVVYGFPRSMINVYLKNLEDKFYAVVVGETGVRFVENIGQHPDNFLELTFNSIYIICNATYSTKII